MQEQQSFEKLVEIMATLRGEHGCPWDKKQTYESLKDCLMDETKEVLEAVDNKDAENLCEELGDVLMNVLLYCQIAKERGDFTAEDVIEGITAKMIRRHPHVFGEEKVETVEEGLALWNRVKALEKAQKCK